LSDLKVVEYAESVSGPFCAKLMADLGAEVIKVEQPPLGDPARQAGPFPGDEPHPERSGLFLYLNTSKYGITLDPRTGKGAATLRELIGTADVLVENMPPGTMETLGIDYRTLSKVNPGLIVTSVTPFGQSGPHAHYKGNDLVCSHMSGLAYHTPAGGVNSLDEEPPLKPGGRQSDFIAGSTSAAATMFAVIHRRMTGLGQHIDVSQQESIACFLRHQTTYVTYDREQFADRYEDRTRSKLGGMFGYLPCKDGHVVNGSREEYQWKDLLALVTDGKWEENETLREVLSGEFDLYSFLEKSDIIRPIILEWTMRHTKEEVAALAQERHVPIVPCNSAEDLFRSPHVAERGSLVEIEHPETGTLSYPGAPYHLSETPWQVRSPAPLLGEHNERILCGRLGYSRHELEQMRESGII